MEAVLLCGLQGSGKTSLFRDRFAATHVHVSLDELRTRRHEEVLVERCLEERLPFVVDNTNPTAADRARYVDPARAAGFKVVGYLVEVDPAVAIAHRAGGVVAATARRLVRPAPEEGFDALWHATAAPGGGWRIEPLLSTPPLF
jgi:hypothetical protein